jgi:DNA modification methylase
MTSSVAGSGASPGDKPAETPPGSVEGLKASRARRREIERTFGFVPLSLIRLSRGALSRSMFTYQHERPERRGGARANYLTNARASGDVERLAAQAEERSGTYGDLWHFSNRKAANGPAASIMPAELVDFYVKYYARPGDLYLDPFAGQGVQMQVAKLRGLDYVGYDLSADFMAYNRAVREKIDDGTTRLDLYEADSRDPHEIDVGTGDFGFTSPPYWDIEYYGPEDAQLGTGQSYEAFLDGMETVAERWLPKFKPGAPLVVNVNDFRRAGRFYPYHADTIVLFQRAGWEVADVWIVEGLVAGLSKVFAVAKFGNGIAPRVHEYAITFRRPKS